MNCLEFQSQLEQNIENRTGPDSSLRQHGETCPNAVCREVWADYVLLNAAISDWKKVPQPVDLVDRILARSPVVPSPVPFTVAPVSRKTKWRISHWGLSGTVCLLVLMAVIVWGWPAGQPSDFVISTEPEEDGYQTLGTMYISWVEGASSGVTGSVASMLTNSTLPRSAPSPVADSSAESETWLQEWGKQLKPLEEELDQTFRVFMGEEPRDQSRTPASEQKEIT